MKYATRAFMLFQTTLRTLSSLFLSHLNYSVIEPGVFCIFVLLHSETRPSFSAMRDLRSPHVQITVAWSAKKRNKFIF